jgi:ABC-type glycerol-3-phosphate transport system substrate-binding protein
MKIRRVSYGLLIIGIIVCSLHAFQVDAGVLREGQPYKGTTINVMITQWTYGNSLKNLIPEFEEATGITVNYDQLSPVEMFKKQGVELALGTSPYDVTEFYPKRQGLKYVEGNWLTALDEFINDPQYTDLQALDLGDFYQNALEACKIDGKTWALPYAEANTILIYRKDILQEKGISSPPDTWEELLDVCAKVHTPDIPAIVFRGGAGANLNMWHFTSLMFAYGAKYFDENMEPLVDTPEMAKAVNIWKTLVQEYAPKGLVGMGGREESTIYMQTGKVVMSIEGNPRVGRIMDPEKSQVIGKLGFAAIPKGPAGRFPNTNTHGLFIPANAEHKEAAWEFIKWATSKEILRKVAVEGQHPSVTRTSVVEDKSYAEKYGFADGEWLATYNETMKTGKFLMPEVKESDEIADTIGLAVADASTGQKTVEQALKDAQKEVRGILERAGYYNK